MNQQANSPQSGADTRTKVECIDRPTRYYLGKYKVTLPNGAVWTTTAENKAQAGRVAEKEYREAQETAGNPLFERSFSSSSLPLEK